MDGPFCRSPSERRNFPVSCLGTAAAVLFLPASFCGSRRDVPVFEERDAMIKKALLLVGGLGVTTLVLFGRDAASYVVDDVPQADQLGAGKRAGRVSDRPCPADGPRPGAGNSPLDARDRQGRSRAGAAQSADRRQSKTKTDKDKRDILRLQADLGKEQEHLSLRQPHVLRPTK